MTDERLSDPVPLRMHKDDLEFYKLEAARFGLTISGMLRARLRLARELSEPEAEPNTPSADPVGHAALAELLSLARLIAGPERQRTAEGDLRSAGLSKVDLRQLGG